MAPIQPDLSDRTSRGINAGSKHDMDDLCAAISANHLRLDDIIDRTFAFGDADNALEYLRLGRQVGKIVIKV